MSLLLRHKQVIRAPVKNTHGASKRYTMRHRRGEFDGKTAILVGGVVAIFLALIISGNILPTALGTIANSTTGNAMKNVDSGTMSIYKLLGLFGVIALALLLLRSTGII